jgi:hypothetical protein
MRRRLLRATGLALAAVMATALLATPASAEPERTEPKRDYPHAGDLGLMYTTAVCDSAGTTPADAALATQLNGRLGAKMRGYMSAYRVSCARMIVKSVRQRGMPSRAAVIAIATAIVEASIDNVSEEVDHDSLGLFQQRASWGSRTQRLNPTWATNAFLDKMVRLYPNNSWMTAQIGVVCQAVQVSDYPERYQPQAADAQTIVNALWYPSNVSIYGVLADGRLTYSAIESGTGDRVHSRNSTATLGFVPVAMATLNFNTILVTNASGHLFRVDVVTNNNSLVFDPPVLLSDRGWVHDLLAYDGLFLWGISDGQLRRYTIQVDKPTAADIKSNTLIDGGFTLTTLAGVGSGWIIGTTAGGQLRSYRIGGAGDWTPYPVKERWGFTHLMSPGGGLYYARTSSGGLYYYTDANPFDGSGDDITYYTDDPVDAGGWTQVRLSAAPFNS